MTILPNTTPTWITHCSRSDLIAGFHPIDPNNTVLIRIAGSLDEFCAPIRNQIYFSIIHEFVFEDTQYPDPDAISEHQAHQLAEVLFNARAHNMCVLVSCSAGICRSGAVVSVGVNHLEFTTRPSIRVPNPTVVSRVGYYVELLMDDIA